MKKLFKKFTVLLVALIMLSTSVLFVACGGDDEDEGEIQYTLTLDATSKSIALMDEFYISANFNEVPNTTLTFKSANEGVATVTDEGKVKGQGIGTSKITVTYGEATATCDVTVSLPAEKPSMSLLGVADITNVMIADDEPFDIIPVITYRGEEYQDAEVTLDVVDDTVGTIVDGKFVPNALTDDTPKSTSISLTATWKGVTVESAPTLLETINVTVYKRDLTNGAHIYLNDTLAYPNGVELYLAPEVDGNLFTNEVEFKIRAVIDGIMGEGTDGIKITYTTNDIVKVENDMLTATGAGTTDVVVELTDDVKANLEGTLMEQLTKIVVPVTVRYLIVDKTEVYHFGEVSARDGYSLADVQATIFGEGEENQIVSATQNYSEDGSGTDLEVINGVLFGMIDKDQEVNATKITLFTRGYGFTFGADVFTDFITTEEEFIAAIKLQDTQVSDYKGDLVDVNRARGTYKLMNDLHFTETWTNHVKIPTGYYGTYGWVSSESGFFGTIDGQGHSVVFDSLGGHGIFGRVGDGTIIKNIDFEVKEMTNRGDQYGVVLGLSVGYFGYGPQNSAGGFPKREGLPTIFENVSIRVTCTQNVSSFDGLADGFYTTTFTDVYFYLSDKVGTRTSNNDNDGYGLISSVNYGTVADAVKALNKLDITAISAQKVLLAAKTPDSVKVDANDSTATKFFKFYTAEEIDELANDAEFIAYNNTTRAPDLEGGGKSYDRFAVTSIKRYDNVAALNTAGVTQVGSWTINADGSVTWANA